MHFYSRILRGPERLSFLMDIRWRSNLERDGDIFDSDRHERQYAENDTRSRSRNQGVRVEAPSALWFVLLAARTTAMAGRPQLEVQPLHRERQPPLRRIRRPGQTVAQFSGALGPTQRNRLNANICHGSLHRVAVITESQ